MATTSFDKLTRYKISKAVRGYLSDGSLSKDEFKFLADAIKESEDGMVSLALVCSLERMRAVLGLEVDKQEDISEDIVEAVANILRSSPVIKVSDDGKKIKRIKQVQTREEVMELLDDRIIAASPFPHDVNGEDVKSFFCQLAKVKNVRLPRLITSKKRSCGTALVEFSAAEDAARILTESLVYKGTQLVLKPKKDFDAERAMEQVNSSHPQTSVNSKKSSNPELNYPKGLIIAFKLKNLSTEESAASNERMAQSSDNVHTQRTDAMDEDKSTGAHNSTADTFTDNKDVLCEDLESLFQNFGNVKLIDFKSGAESGYIHFEEAESSQKACAVAGFTRDGGFTVKNFVAVLEPLTGEAEKEYWKQFIGNHDNKSCAGWDSENRLGEQDGRASSGSKNLNGKRNRSKDVESQYSEKFRRLVASWGY